MALHKIRDVNPHYRFTNEDIMGFNIYTGEEVIGSVDDILLDDDGKFRYFVMHVGRWFSSKRVLLPVALAQVSFNDRCLRTQGLTREQIGILPEYDPKHLVDYHYEEQVRGVYRPTIARAAPRQNAADVAAPEPNSAVTPLAVDDNGPTFNSTEFAATSDRYTYSQDPGLYELDKPIHQDLKLYEERLIADKTRQKAGEVAVGKRVETEMAQVAVPIEKERVVIETIASPTAAAPVESVEGVFAEGEVARVEVYEESPDIHKEAFLREEVDVRKEVDHDVVKAEEQLRREELDVKTEGTPVVKQRSQAIPEELL